ncbi:MAG: hypothetical protein AAGJ35_02045 [Myxococcota bacterium]
MNDSVIRQSPILRYALAALQVDDQGNYCFDQEGLAFIHHGLAQCANETEFRQALKELCGLNLYFYREGHTYANQALAYSLGSLIQSYFSLEETQALHQEVRDSGLHQRAYQDMLAQRGHIFEDEQQQDKEGSLNAKELAVQLQGHVKIGP